MISSMVSDDIRLTYSTKQKLLQNCISWYLKYIQHFLIIWELIRIPRDLCISYAQSTFRA